MPTATKKTAAKKPAARKSPAKKTAAAKKTTSRAKPAAAKKTTPPSVKKIPRPAPAELGAAGRKLWAEITGTYELRPDEYRILEDAAREADLVEHLAEVQRESPIMITGSMGQQVLHPVIAEVRQHRATLSQLLVKLKLPDDPGTPAAGTAAGGTAPAGNDRANQARAAANARWSRRGT